MASYSLAALRLAPTELVIVQPTTLCNLNCEYCFLPLRKDNLTLAVADLQTIFSNLTYDRLLRPKTTVCWHLGEPTVLPIEYYREAQAIIRQACPDVRFRFTIQTNGTRITNDWCSFFIEEAMTVGISFDGDDFDNNRRKDRGGSSSFTRVRDGLARLQHNNVDYYIIAVLSKPVLTKPHSFYRFFKDLRVKQLCLNVVESEGGGIPPFLADDSVFGLISDFYGELWQIVASDPDPIWIREIDHSQQAIVAGKDGVSSAQEMTAGRILTILWNGHTLPYTPGFATLKRRELERFTIGNLISSPLSLGRNDANCKFLDEAVSQLYRQCAEHCDYFSVCGGGSPAHRWAEFGHFDEHVTRTCQASIQARMRGVVSSMRQRLSAL